MEINLNSKNYLQSNSESFEPIKPETHLQYKDQLLSQHQRVETNKSYSICSLIQDFFSGIWNLIKCLFCCRYQTKESSQSLGTSAMEESITSSTTTLNTEEEHRPETKQQLLPNPQLEQNTETKKEPKLETEQEPFLDFSKLLLSMHPSTSLDATKIQSKTKQEAFEQFLDKLSENILLVGSNESISFANNRQTHLSIVLYLLCEYEGNKYVHPFNLFGFFPTHELISYLIETHKPGLFVEFSIQSIYSRQIKKTTPLHRVKSVKTAKLLLEKNPDLLKTKNSEGQIPLHMATNVEIATFLIEQGSDVNAEDNDKNCPLHEASSLELVELLLASGAKVNVYNYYRETPLIKMVSDKKEELALRLLKAGAKTNEYDRNKEPLFHLAIEKKLSRMVPYLIENGHIAKGIWLDEENPEGRTPLALALNNASYDLHGESLTYAEQLIEAGAKLDVPMKKGSLDFIIHFVIEKKLDEIFYLMIQKGVDIEKKDSNKRTALACAIHQYYYTKHENVKKMVKTLIDQGAELDAYIGRDYLLHYVVGKKYYDIFTWMMKKGVSLKDKGENGRTPLACALDWARYEENNKDLQKIIHDLIAKGSDLNVKIGSNSDDSILHFVIQKKWAKILTWMIQKRGLDLEVKDGRGFTPFTLALYNSSFGLDEDNFPVIKLLIAAGANTSVKMSTDFKTMPIHYVIKKHLAEILDALIEKKADLEALDDDGRTPLAHALRSTSYSYQPDESLKIAEKLIHAGAKIDVKMDSKSKQTVFQFAFENKFESICKLMKEKGATE